MYVEFIGLSGSGKTTLAKSMMSSVRKRGFKARSLNRYVDGAAPKDLHNWNKRRSEEKSRMRHRLLALWEACAKHPEFASNAFFASMTLPAQHSDFAVALLAWSEAQMLGHRRLLLATDEGLLHRGIAAHQAAEDGGAFRAFLENVPMPDVLVHMDVAPQEAIRRARTRPRRQAVPRSSDAEKHLSEMAEMISLASSAAEKRGVPVVTVPKSEQPMDAAERIADLVLPLLENE